MGAIDGESLVESLLRGPPMAVLKEWTPPALSAVSELTLSTLTVGSIAFWNVLFDLRVQGVLACRGPDGEPWVAGLVMKRNRGFKGVGVVLVGDLCALVSVRRGRETIEFLSGNGTLAMGRHAFLSLPRRRSEYVMEGEGSVVIDLPWAFSTNGMQRWQFDAVEGGNGMVRLRGAALAGFVRTVSESVGMERPDPRCLVTRDPAGFALLKRMTALGSPLFSARACGALMGVSEGLRRLAMVAAIWERMRFEYPDSGA